MPAQNASKKIDGIPVAFKTTEVRGTHMQVNTETSKFEINNNPVTDISYAIGNSPFGDFFIAATKVGICQLDFLNPDAITDSVSKLNLAWPLANITPGTPRFLTSVEAFFQGQYCDTKQLSLHMTGTDFQIKVWQALLKIPAGSTTLTPI